MPGPRPRRGPGIVRLLLPAFLAAFASAPACAQSGRGDADERLSDFRSSTRSRPGGVLGLMGYNMTPDGSTNAVEVNRAAAARRGMVPDSSQLLLGQFGFGFTASESLPVFLEIYFGYARYDPRALFSGQGARHLPFRWNNVAATVGIGYDIALTENLFLRPVVNFSLGYAASDAALFGSWMGSVAGADATRLTDQHVHVWGRGGALMLAYYDLRPERDVELELRYTHLRLETFGDSASPARGSSTAQTLGLWGRYRWPTGWEAFGREMRWVIDGSASLYLGDQREAIGFGWSAKIGGGIEFDIGRREIGALGLNLSRIRLIGRYFFGDNGVTGTSIGIGISF